MSLDKFNLEFAVDPLFKKTCADFDEGGARGLLLNHLSVDVEGKIIFDAGDARDEGDDGDDDEDEEEDGQEDEEAAKSNQDDERQGDKPAKKRTDVEAAMIDIQRLRCMCTNFSMVCLCLRKLVFTKCPLYWLMPY